MFWELLIIIVVFGGLLSVFLYLYLLRGQKGGGNSMLTAGGTEATLPSEEEIAKHLDELFTKVEDLELKINSLHDYVEQLVKRKRK